MFLYSQSFIILLIHDVFLFGLLLYQKVIMKQELSKLEECPNTSDQKEIRNFL